MSQKRPLTIVIILFFGIQATTSLKFQEAYQKYCIPAPLTTSMSVADRISARTSIRGVPVDLINIAAGTDAEMTRRVVQSLPGTFIVLLIILALFLVISALIFLGFCCCCDRADRPNDANATRLTMAGVAFLGVIAALFITAVVFLGLMQNQMGKMPCSIARIPYEIIYGATLSGKYRFLGLRNIEKTFTKFVGTMESMSQVTTEYMNIVGRNLPAYTISGLQSLTAFYSRFANSTSDNGNSTQAVPISVRSMTPLVNDGLDWEFTLFNQTATKLTQACRNAIELIFGQQASISSPTFKASLDSASTQISDMTKYATDSLAPSFATVSQVAANIPTGYWIIFAFTLVLLVIGLFIAWSIHQMSNKKSDHRRRMAKGCLIFFALLGLGVTVASIFLFITSVGMSTACAALPTILESRENSAGSTLSKWGFPLSDIGSSMLNICVSSDGNGDLASMFPATATSAAQMALQYIDGVVAFRNIQSNLTNSNTTSPAIQLTVNRWQMYQLGYLFDQQVAETQRKTLNHMVSCGSQSFQFSSQNCTSTSCVGIRETSNPIVTSCAPPAASTILANLQQYMSQEITLLTTMINALNSTNTQTPNSAQVTSRMAFFQTVPDFTSITNMAGSFLVDLPSMTGSFLDNTNCTALRTQLLALEEKICFSFNNYLYYFTCMAIFCAFFTLVVSWLLCGGLFVVGERVEILVGTLPAEIKSELKLISEGPIEVDSNPLY